ncbi:MAG: nitrous oxide-stimulated promoter family protein [Anaerovibrio sp.]|nr:nitrous oxide-stimulated promoter family protein [Anaerovibrio sp.]
MDKVQHKREQELATVTEMIGIFCHDIHKTDGEHLCHECQDLLDYVKKRVAVCPRMGEKTFCSACNTHCYAPNRRERIRMIMRYSGPKMMFRSPLLAIKHKLTEWFAIKQKIL